MDSTCKDEWVCPGCLQRVQPSDVRRHASECPYVDGAGELQDEAFRLRLQESLDRNREILGLLAQEADEGAR